MVRTCPFFEGGPCPRASFSHSHSHSHSPPHLPSRYLDNVYTDMFVPVRSHLYGQGSLRYVACCIGHHFHYIPTAASAPSYPHHRTIVPCDMQERRNVVVPLDAGQQRRPAGQDGLQVRTVQRGAPCSCPVSRQPSPAPRAAPLFAGHVARARSSPTLCTFTTAKSPSGPFAASSTQATGAPPRALS